MSSTTTRVLAPPDLEALVGLEEAARLVSGAEVPSWSRAALAEELVHVDAVVVGAFVDDVLAAYVVERAIADEWWILNITTAPAFRRRGLGRVLVDDAIARAGARSLWLEVREGNVGARALYEQCGFDVVGRRPGYYPPLPPDTRRETAVLMSRRG